MTYPKRMALLMLLDCLLTMMSLLMGQLIVGNHLPMTPTRWILLFCVLVVGHYLMSFGYRLYKKAWAYASIGELVAILKIVTLSIVATSLVQWLFTHRLSLRFFAVTWMVQLFLIGTSRFLWRISRDTYIQGRKQKQRTLIIGAGSAGTMVARQLLNNKGAELQPMGFIDDDHKKQRLHFLGLPVLGGVAAIETIVEHYDVQNVVIAIPSLSRKKLNAIFQECLKTKAKTQIIPRLEDLVTGKVSVNQFRDVEVEDLLGRDPVELDMAKISDDVTGKTVLVTGAGGSIGSELCRQLSHFQPKRLVLLGHGENSIYSIEMELKDYCMKREIELVSVIADLQDRQRIEAVIATYRPHVIYHAAAHKHVPLMEANPEEAVKNNIIGTLNVARAASLSKVETFVLISSDKAVKPTSVMGATKRLAEMLIQHLDATSQTTFVAVRFGNVLGSRGSVIPLFKKQIEKGGPVTVTHPDMIRYFMTIPEASRLVIQAGALAKGGEIFILDMGEPVKIVDLAKNLIQLSGNQIEEIGITYTGVRPGEKLFEELLTEEEVHEEQIFPKIYIGKATGVYLPEIEQIIGGYAALDQTALKERLVQLANHKVSASLVSVSS
ncbi:UDP-N-acetylglucosamine 4,6-dehydratase [Pullulanibacillus camelliae]|uniref:UDP-N-acetylglucosamine 4,6-dehydratase n=1 Tax=Pullulanibacillus camelliae TaxID=1707096 RepID=A0A8J2VL11_9BACL|nr:nucleoside-diphosphate sugar epimerase/dehydratase [Pullulanibacillus camelliae]GGE30442.1 UDP-N-acetylglucosamine 4,6-dehydratase [Pullulanibacillus camelliae]